MKEKILLAWSGGKDSTLALYELIRSGKYEITALLSTVTQGYDRISMHGVRRSLLEKQAESLGFSLDVVFIPQKCTNEEYERRMERKMIEWKEKGVFKVAFGDIFLQDVREYRERNLAKAGMEAIFPLWGRESRELARRFIDLGFKAVLTCVDGEVLSGDFAGKEFDAELLTSLPSSVDPSGENGEFHTFVYDGPLFKESVKFQKGEIVLRENRFFFCDLIPIS
ncbi:MAG: diphthine--ammonia ligase [bacterium]